MKRACLQSLLLLCLLTARCGAAEKSVSRKAQEPKPVRWGLIAWGAKPIDWGKTPVLAGDFHLLGTGGPVAREANARVRLAADKDNLYIRYECIEPRMGNLVDLYTGSDIWMNDCFEVFLDARGRRQEYTQIVVSPSGRSHAYTPAGQFSEAQAEGRWSVATRKGRNSWGGVLTIAWKFLGVRPAPGMLMTATFCRERRAGGGLQLSTWTPPRGFHKPGDFGTLVIGTMPDFFRVAADEISRELESARKVLSDLPETNSARKQLGAWQKLLDRARVLQGDADRKATDFLQWLARRDKLEQRGTLKEMRYEQKLRALLRQD